MPQSSAILIDGKKLPHVALYGRYLPGHVPGPRLAFGHVYGYQLLKLSGKGDDAGSAAHQLVKRLVHVVIYRDPRVHTVHPVYEPCPIALLSSRVAVYPLLQP